MTRLQEFTEQIGVLAPAGFYVALRVGFSFPSEELNQLPEPWVEHYTKHGLVVYDPLMKWVYATTGVARVSELQAPDPMGIVATAALFGLTHGAVASAHLSTDHGRRSFGFFFRSDREYQTSELDLLVSLLSLLHADPVQPLDHALTGAEIEALRLLSRGMRLRQIADTIGISESAVKARLNGAKRKLSARTVSQAATIAASRRLF
jgi:LuxR family transcriptional regulator, quorum-sensing system regulator SdiA